ncbi:hypothetical protein ANANG_G00071670 [Anguilla anguilla]|uniref:Uncharacterized protein n=1 Tax=Anguilla anguilla TaxID=7936 RepID=A0A9D3MUW0_ANGAN|nr:hypothetical protein ANANG_G00071670 [Anguilla anguilla]
MPNFTSAFSDGPLTRALAVRGGRPVHPPAGSLKRSRSAVLGAARAVERFPFVDSPFPRGARVPPPALLVRGFRQREGVDANLNADLQAPSGCWMHHPAEQFGGRGTRDSFPLDSLNRAPWAPVSGRAWAPPPRCSSSANQPLPHLPPGHMTGPNHPSKFFNNGLPVRGPDKLELSQAVGSALQRDQRQPRLWEQLGHLYEQDGPKPDDPARSYPGPARPHNGYAAGPGPGGHFAPRPNQLLRFGSPHQQHGARNSAPLGEVWNPVQQQSRGFPGKMMGGQLKRPAPPLGEHSVIQHAPPPPLHHPAPPSEDCPSPSKRTRGSSSEQIPHPAMQRYPIPGHPQAPPLHPPPQYPPPKPGFWNSLHKTGAPGPRPTERGSHGLPVTRHGGLHLQGSSWRPHPRLPAPCLIRAMQGRDARADPGGSWPRGLTGRAVWAPAPRAERDRGRPAPSPANLTGVPYSHPHPHHQPHPHPHPGHGHGHTGPLGPPPYLSTRPRRPGGHTRGTTATHWPRVSMGLYWNLRVSSSSSTTIIIIITIIIIVLGRKTSSAPPPQEPPSPRNHLQRPQHCASTPERPLPRQHRPWDSAPCWHHGAVRQPRLGWQRSRFQRSGVITSTASGGPQQTTSSKLHPSATAPLTAAPIPVPAPVPKRPPRPRVPQRPPAGSSCAFAFCSPCHPQSLRPQNVAAPPAPRPPSAAATPPSAQSRPAGPQSIQEALDKLDAELQGHMQAEEKLRSLECARKPQQERKTAERREGKEGEKGGKREEERAIENLERLLSGTVPRPPPLSARVHPAPPPPPPHPKTPRRRRPVERAGAPAPAGPSAPGTSQALPGHTEGGLVLLLHQQSRSFQLQYRHGPRAQARGPDGRPGPAGGLRRRRLGQRPVRRGAPELSTILPDGLANIMKMLDESIKKEEEMCSGQDLGHYPPPSPIQGYLCAPNLIPAPRQHPVEDLGTNAHASPPVLSRQGSLASSLCEEEEEEAMKVVPKPNQGSAPPAAPLVSQAQDGRGADYRHSDLAKLYGLPDPAKGDGEDDEDEDEDDEESNEASCSPPPQRPHLHQTGVNSMFRSLASVLGSQKYAYRGGPFGRPPPNSVTGVKYSSSLSLGPEICRQQGTSPTSGSAAHPGYGSSPQNSAHATSEKPLPLCLS